MNIRILSSLLVLTLFSSCATTLPAPAGAKDAIAERVKKWEAKPGFFPLYWDDKKGELWLEIPQLEREFIYFTSLPGGVGSNDIGLDRGQVGPERLVKFTRSGNRVLLVQPNLAFRATTKDELERRAVEDSFATSVLAGFTVEAEEGGRVLVNATDFFLRDAHDVIGALKASKQGTFTLDNKRSAFHLARTKSFPRNTEVEVTLTFGGTEPGQFVKDVTPDPRSITVRERHSFVQLPEPGYVPRVFDPGAGHIMMSYADYSVPIAESIVRRFIVRHRLEKKDPQAARSVAVRPIIFYLDSGTPEPIRSALLEGARWWSAAFEAAGFIDAYRVEMLPEGADMQDVRYNTIQWVHRATRGWSYGMSITDPRTGEIIKGHVSLGSLRVRQDYLIVEGLLAPYEEGKPVSPEMERMALARLRQLSAHEVGHTLGLKHNFLSSGANRASVMDYPHPFAKLRPDRTIDLSDAYATGVGEWDKVAIAAAYTHFAPGTNEVAAVSGLLSQARERGLFYLTDQDARPMGGAHPRAHLWDSGTNAIDELQRMLDVRAAALARFGENVIKPGRPLATIEEALVPIYLSHRYQVDAAAKFVAGQDYSYALRGDGQTALATVPAAEQWRAVDVLLSSVAPATLRLPDSLLRVLPPRPEGFPATRELFSRRTGITFDALAPAEAAATTMFTLLFHPQRASRLVQQHARDPQLPGLDQLVNRVFDATWHRTASAGFDGELQRVVDNVTLSRLLRLGADDAAGTPVQAIVIQKLVRLRDTLVESGKGDTSQHAHHAYGARLIDQFLDNPKEFAPAPLSVVPPGQPIGSTMQCDFEFDGPVLLTRE